MAYEGERYDPSLQRCGDMALAFDGTALAFWTGTVSYRYSAVSGRATQEGNFIYTSARQRQSGIGPIPEGVYWINPSEMWTNGWMSLASTSAWGNHRITIHPFTTTETFGRGGFFIHGGATPGSAGCIDLAGEMDRFHADFLRHVGARQTCQMHLRVAYPVPGDYPTPRLDQRSA
jgi:hypothetical protein